MAIKKFTIEANFPEEQVKAFAITRNWEEEVSHIETDADGKTVATMVPNPITPDMFCTQYFKDYLVSEVGSMAVKEIERIFSEQKRAQVDTVLGQIGAAINVIVE